VSEELSGRSNITILQADLTDYKAIKVRGATMLMREAKLMKRHRRALWRRLPRSLAEVWMF
jgi:hypothetical protein